MKEIKNNIGNITKVFAETFEFEAYDQVKKLSNYEPYLNSKIRIMPDAHAGKGCTVGTTMTIIDKVTPNLVGVDIGCGMLTVKLKNKDIDFNRLDEVIRHKIPHGNSVHSPSSIHRPKIRFDFTNLLCGKYQEYIDLKRAQLSLGSLGGGNHFIEINKSEITGELYLVIHSGSRKLGTDVCKYYQDKAFQNLNEMGKIKNNLIEKLKKEGRQKDIDAELKKIQKPPADKELAHLTGQHFHDYINDMKIVQQFAVLNRKCISDIICKEMNFQIEESFETIHNYIDFYRMILRKGAVSAEKNEKLLIPINMRDGSLICIGKGNEDWNYSAPHGAGRLMSRSKAKEMLNLNEYQESMKGIFTTSVGTETIDEAPQVYKTIEEIKNNITDTVDIVEVIKPLYNFKSN